MCAWCRGSSFWFPNRAVVLLLYAGEPVVAGALPFFFLLQLTPRGTETMYGGTDGGAGEYTINVYVYHRSTTTNYHYPPHDTH